MINIISTKINIFSIVTTFTSVINIFSISTVVSLAIRLFNIDWAISITINRYDIAIFVFNDYDGGLIKNEESFFFVFACSIDEFVRDDNFTFSINLEGLDHIEEFSGVVDLHELFDSVWPLILLDEWEIGLLDSAEFSFQELD